MEEVSQEESKESRTKQDASDDTQQTALEKESRGGRLLIYCKGGRVNCPENQGDRAILDDPDDCKGRRVKQQ